MKPDLTGFVWAGNFSIKPLLENDRNFLREAIQTVTRRKLDFAVVKSQYENTKSLYVKVEGKEAQRAAMQAQGLKFYSNFDSEVDLASDIKRLKKAGFRTQVLDNAYGLNGYFVYHCKALYIGRTKKSHLRALCLQGQGKFLEKIGYIYVGATDEHLNYIKKFLERNQIPYQITGSENPYHISINARKIFISKHAWKYVFGKSALNSQLPSGVYCYK